ncbi:hypothetical protein TNCV_3422761 [Trichonephila clavipes]|nr:hypothetical protein TNCV_3422761 [Trichonephila clavipes]
MNETTQQKKQLKLGNRNETTQLGSRNETTQLVSRNETTQLRNETSRRPPTPACNHLQPPATAYNHLHREKELPNSTTVSNKITQGNSTASCKRLISWFLLDKVTELGHKIVPVRPPKF